MPSVSTRHRHTMAAHSWIKRGRRTSNNKREREIRTRTNNIIIKEGEAEEDNVMSKRRGMRRTMRRRMGRRRWEAWEESEEKDEGEAWEEGQEGQKGPTIKTP